jgi:GNAT superfamily N-acetyltransferase
VTVPLPTLPAGFDARALTPNDAEAVAALVADCEEVEDGWRETKAEDVLAAWSLPEMDLATGSVGVFANGALAASGDVHGDYASVDVHPSFRGRGLGSALLPWTWAQARAQGKDRVVQDLSDARTDAAALVRAHGYEPAWTGWSFRMPIADTTHPTLPAGYTFVDYDHRTHGRAAFDVVNTAFNEWREAPEDDWPSWDAYIGGHTFLAPWGSPLIVHDDRIVGVSIAFDAGTDQDAWIQQLAVDRAHRGRGLGHALIRETFARFAARGFGHGGLATDSRTGALAMYEHVGFEVRSSWTRWRKRL